MKRKERHNNRINSDWQFRCASVCQPVMRSDGADAPRLRHRGRVLPSTGCPALRAGHPAYAADGRPREQARVTACR